MIWNRHFAFYLALGFCSCVLSGCDRSVLDDISSDGSLEPSVVKEAASDKVVVPPSIGENVFSNKKVLRISLKFEDSDVDVLQQEHRPYVRAVFADDNSVMNSVGIKLKGAAGSYQLLDGKPGFTVKFDKFRKKQSLDGLDKVHLNNSVQDGSYLCEWLGSEVFRQANYPSPRVAHALLQWNERSNAVYVIREAYDRSLLRRFFSNPDGNLYDGGFLQDLDADLEKDSGQGVDDRSDLKQIMAALNDSNANVRYRETEKRIDLDRFLTFMALETMLCHWDGYSMNANNYRVYVDPESNLAVFMPHGMDQLFGDTNMPLFNFPSPQVSSQIMGNNAWRARYRNRISELLSIFDPPSNLIDRLEVVAIELRSAIEELGVQPLHEFESQFSELKLRIQNRVMNIKEQLAQPEAEPLSIAVDDSCPLQDWYPVCDQEPMAMRQAEGSDEKELRLSILEEPGYASWRHSFYLERGTYRIEGRYRAEGIKPFDEFSKQSIVVGTTQQEVWSSPESEEWQNLTTTITVVEDRLKVEWIVGLRAGKGHLRIDPASFRISRIEDVAN